ncbi:MAG: DUF4430 domain-containing protein [Solirubrobacteraceae bacterium]
MRRRAGIALALAALAVGGCGVGAGTKPAGTALTITRDFGAHAVHTAAAPKVGGSETVMRLLQRNAKVTTRYGGGFVQSIDGLAGGTSHGQPVDWFFYVNGVEATQGAAAIRLHPGDRVWWDHHDWSATQTIPAVVGSFPEPFVHGLGGKRLPVRIECADPGGPACDAVSKRLAGLGVPAAQGGLNGTRLQDTLRVVVAPLATVAGDPTLAALAGGPRASGVYARPARGGRALVTLNADGRPVSMLGTGSGLVAALRPDAGTEPIWVVSGTDAAGMRAAADAFSEAALRNRFAVAVTGGQARALPEAGR